MIHESLPQTMTFERHIRDMHDEAIATVVDAPVEFDDWGDGPVENRKVYGRLRSGNLVMHDSTTQRINGETIVSTTIQIDYIPGGTDRLIDNGQGGYTATSEGLSEYIYVEEVTITDAAVDTKFMSVFNRITQAMTGELPEHVQGLVMPDLSYTLLAVAPESNEGDSGLQVGYAEQALHGQDAALADFKQMLFGVFDGVGGAECSEVAARLTAKVVQEYVAATEAILPEQVEATLRASLIAADQRLGDYRYLEKVGLTTATIAQFVGSALVWAHVGDSRLFVVKEGSITQITSDEGEGNHLDNAVGGRMKLTQSGIIELAEGAEVILVTDGITGDRAPDLLHKSDIQKVLTESPSAQAAAENLVQAARKIDDRTAMVIRR